MFGLSNESKEEYLDNVRRVIKQEFDLEILYKKYEIQFLRAEIEKRRSILPDLKQLIYYDYLLQGGHAMKDSSSSTTIDMQSLLPTSQKPFTDSDNITSHPVVPTSTHESQQYQYERRPDGVIVK